MLNARHIAVAAVCGLVAASSMITGTAAAQDMMTVGWNASGQLGFPTGPNPNVAIPVNIGGLPGEIVDFSCGWSHNLALLDDGTVWAWGDNNAGQLGDGTNTARATPLPVPGVTDIIAVAGGTNHSLALRSDGTVLAWGGNGWGQCGVGTNGNNYTTPAQVHWLNNITTISAGDYFSMALRSDGTVWTWGRNQYGQLGNGTTTNATTAVMVAGLSNIIQISAGGDHALALRSNKTIAAWGQNTYGQLGNNSTANSSLPVNTIHAGPFVQIAAGGMHSLARTEGGLVYAWGNNYAGQLGDGTKTDRHVPTHVEHISTANLIFASRFFSGAVRNNKLLLVWGTNFSGQLGDGSLMDRTTPGPVGLVSHALSAYAGTGHLVVLVPSQSPEPTTCPADLTGDDTVDVSDLIQLLGAWGACP